LEVVTNCFPAIIAILLSLSKDAEANGLLGKMKTFEFVFGVIMLRRVLKYCKSLCEYLQTEDLDISAAANAVSDIISKITAMRNDEECRDYYETACTKFQKMCTSCAAVSVHDPDDESSAQRSRKVPKRLHERITDQFLTETLTDLYDKLRIDLYFPILDRVIANLHERFEDKNKAIMDGTAALQFDTRMSAVDTVSSAEKFAALYSYMGLNVEQCCVQFKLAAQKQQLIDQSPKTVKTAWAVFCEHRLTDGCAENGGPNLG